MPYGVIPLLILFIKRVSGIELIKTISSSHKWIVQNLNIWFQHSSQPFFDFTCFSLIPPLPTVKIILTLSVSCQVQASTDRSWFSILLGGHHALACKSSYLKVVLSCWYTLYHMLHLFSILDSQKILYLHKNCLYKLRVTCLQIHSAGWTPRLLRTQLYNLEPLPVYISNCNRNPIHESQSDRIFMLHFVFGLLGEIFLEK